MNILNIFNNLVTLSTLHSPTHSQTKQPQCSCKYNMYQHVAPTSQDNPPMSAASEESTADFLPKALQTGKKGDRAAETGRQKRGDRNGRQKRGDRNGRQKRAAGPGRQEADAGERAEGHRQPEVGIEKSRTRTPQNRIRTGKARNRTQKSENRDGKSENWQGKPGNWQRSRMPKRPAFRKRSGSGRDKTKKRKLGIKTDRPSSTVSSPT